MGKIYYIEIDEINSKIEELFEVLFEMKNKKIVEIESKNYEIVNVYLNSGIIWKAFLRNGEKIYLNTEFQISLDVTDIFNKYGDWNRNVNKKNDKHINLRLVLCQEKGDYNEKFLEKRRKQYRNTRY